jgi:hypothetical protein
MTSSSKFLQPDEGRRTVYDNKKRTKREQKDNKLLKISNRLIAAATNLIKWSLYFRGEGPCSAVVSVEKEGVSWSVQSKPTDRCNRRTKRIDHFLFVLFVLFWLHASITTSRAWLSLIRETVAETVKICM